MIDIYSKQDSWLEVPLEDCANILDAKRIPINTSERTKRTEGKSRNELFPYYGATGEAGLIDDFIFEGEHLLIGEDGAPFFDKTKSVAFIVKDKFWVNNHAHILKAFDSVTSNKYLCHFLNQFNFQGFVAGSTRLKLNQANLKRIPVPLAPLNTQNAIVDKIEELFSHIDAGVEGLKQAKAKLQQYRQSVLKDAVKGKLTETWRVQNAYKLEPADELLESILVERRANWEAEQLRAFKEKGKTPKDDKWKEKYVEPKEALQQDCLPNGWASAITDQVFSFITSGSRGWAKYYSDDGPLFLRVGNLFHYNVELDLRKLQRVSPPEGSEGSRTKVQEGDNLISITADVGMVGYVPSNFEESYINQHVALARPVQKVMGKYLSWLLSGDFAKEQFKALQKGATKAGLGLDDIRSISFGLPSLLEQEQIVQEIETRISGLDKLKKEIELKILHASKLKSSILADAFSGKLVENIETDETAEQLLEKIKAEKEKQLAGKPNAAIKRKKKVTSERKSLLTILSEQSEAVTPDVLMQEAGFTSLDIDDFYVELASIAEKIEQISPEQNTLKNWPYDKAANIKIKLKD